MLGIASALERPILTTRQAQVLHAVASAYVGFGAPTASDTIAALLPVALSSASVRNTLAELDEMGLVEKPHRSAGRTPTERGMSVFVNQLLSVRELGAFEKHSLEGSLEQGGPTALARVASRLLSERTHQLGFVLAPRLDALVLRHVSFVRVSTERLLVILISEGGRAFQRVLEEPGQGDQAQLDRLAASLNERIAGETLRSLRDRLIHEASALRGQAERLLERVLRPAAECDAFDAVDVVIATRLELLQQPEFHDPERLRVLLQTVEETETLIGLVDRVIARPGAGVLFGHEVPEPEFHHCALVAARYGPDRAPLGALGVIGPSRMDFARVIPVVSYLSLLLTEHLEA